MTINLIFLKFIILRFTRDLRGKKEKAVQPEVDQMQLVTIISQGIFRMNIRVLSQLPHLLNGIYGCTAQCLIKSLLYNIL